MCVCVCVYVCVCIFIPATHCSHEVCKCVDIQKKTDRIKNTVRVSSLLVLTADIV